MDQAFYRFFLCEIAVLLAVGFGALYQRGRYFVPVIVGLSARLFLVYIHEVTRLFGDVDLDDYLPFFKRFNWFYGEEGEISPVLGLDATAYTLLYPGWLYYWFGDSGLWVLRVIGSLISVLVLWPLADLHRRVFKRPMSVWVALLVMLWPTWLRYSIEAGRSSITVLTALVPVKYLLDYAEERRGRDLFAAFLWIIPAFIFRVESAAFYAFILSYLVIRSFTRINPYMKVILFPFVMAAISGAFFGAAYIYRTYLGGGLLDPRWIKKFIEWRSGGGSDYLVGLYPGSPFGLAWYVPLHAFYFLFSPMPWDAAKPFVIGSTIQAWIIFFMIILSFRRNWTVYKGNKMLRLLMWTLLFVVVGYGAVTKNAGGAERWRIPISLVLLTVLPLLDKNYLKTPYDDLRAARNDTSPDVAPSFEGPTLRS